MESNSGNCLINHACITQAPYIQDKVGRASVLVDTLRSWEGSGLREGMEALCSFHIPCPMNLLHLATPELYPI